MKLFSAELSGSGGTTTAKAVVMQKKGRAFSMLKYYTTDVDNIQHLSKGMPLNIGINYFDTIEETVTLPPVKDSETFRIISMNKLKENMDPSVEYLMAYKANASALPDSSGSLTYKVLLVPSSMLYEDSGLPEETMGQLNMFTVSDFALCALVNKYFPDRTVFHAFADETRICVTICVNDYILYTRNNPTEKGSNLLSAYYEYLNLTYMYATKNLRLKIDNIVFSGKLADMSELVTMFYEFSGVAQSTLIPAGVVENCPNDIFQEYMIPISLCYLDSAYDMTPAPIIKKQATSYATGIMNVAALLCIMLLLFMNMSALANLYENRETMTLQAQALSGRIKNYLTEVSAGHGKHFDLHYYRTLEKRQQSVPREFGMFAPLLALGNFDIVTFDASKDGEKSVEIGGTLHFGKLAQMENFKESLESKLAGITNGSGYSLDNGTVFKTNEMSVTVKLLFKKGGE